jgi:hypothetical protein
MVELSQKCATHFYLSSSAYLSSLPINNVQQWLVHEWIPKISLTSCFLSFVIELSLPCHQTSIYWQLQGFCRFFYIAHRWFLHFYISNLVALNHQINVCTFHTLWRSYLWTLCTPDATHQQAIANIAFIFVREQIEEGSYVGLLVRMSNAHCILQYQLRSTFSKIGSC